MTTKHTLTMPSFLALVAVFALFAFSPAVGATSADQSDNFPARIDLPNGFFPEGIEGGRGTTFFVGSLLDGTILRGDLRTGSTAVRAAGATGSAAAGIAYEARRDRIWVAGRRRVARVNPTLLRRA
jgi:hypothetical protein